MAPQNPCMLLSVVIPVFNEADILPTLLRTLRQVLADIDCDYELVFVNDGSADGTLDILREAAVSDPRVKVLGFGRNFGHQAAITAGLDFASGDAVVVMDADLQDPPEILPEMVELFRHGYDVVSPQRVTRAGESWLRLTVVSLFYWVARRMVDQRIIPEVGDFRLFSRAAIVAIRNFREQHRFMRGLVAWLGLKEVILPFHRQPRYAGNTKYSYFKSGRLAWAAISSFSALPLRMCLMFGALLTGGGFVYLGYSLYLTFVIHRTVPGWTSLVCLQVLFSGAILLAIGLVGDYVARIYEEAKGRPLYVVTETLNVLQDQGNAPRTLVLPARDLAGSTSSAAMPSSLPSIRMRH